MQPSMPVQQKLIRACHLIRCLAFVSSFIALVWFTFVTFNGNENRLKVVLKSFDFCLSRCPSKTANLEVPCSEKLFADDTKSRARPSYGAIDEIQSGLEPLAYETTTRKDGMADEEGEKEEEEEEGVKETENFQSNRPRREQRLPQCLIIGVRKGGTRALIEFLALHPSIRAQSHEVHFFDDDEFYSRGLHWYKHRMPHTLPSEITIEKTPAYFVKDRVPERVFTMNSSVKLLLIVRNPVSRTLSDYTQLSVSKSGPNGIYPSFESLAIDHKTGRVKKNYKAIRRSLYHRHMKKWLDFFKRDQMHLISGEDLVKDPLSELIKVERFLGLNRRLNADQFYLNATRGFYCMKLEGGGTKCLGSSKGRNHVEVRQEVLGKMAAFFKPHNKKFYRLVGRDFGW